MDEPICLIDTSVVITEPLTEAMKTELFTSLLPWGEEILRRRYGEEGMEWAGLALHNAFENYDPSRGIPFKIYVYKQLIWTARNELRQVNGRIGSVEWKIRRKHTFSVEDWDADHISADRGLVAQPDMNAAMIARETWIALLKTADAIEDENLRMLAIGRVIGFKHDAIGKMMGVTGESVRRQMREVKQLLWNGIGGDEVDAA